MQNAVSKVWVEQVHRHSEACMLPQAGSWGRVGSTQNEADDAPCLPVHSAWHMSACHRVATVPSTLPRWCPQQPSQMQYSLTAYPILSTWQ